MPFTAALSNICPTDFARSSTVSIILSCAMVFCAAIVGLSGCLCRKKTPLLLASLVLYLSCMQAKFLLCEAQNTCNRTFWNFFAGSRFRLTELWIHLLYCRKNIEVQLSRSFAKQCLCAHQAKAARLNALLVYFLLKGCSDMRQADFVIFQNQLRLGSHRLKNRPVVDIT